MHRTASRCITVVEDTSLTTTEKDSAEESPAHEGSASWKLSALISGVILLLAGGLAAFTFFTEPTAERGGATKKTAMLVDVVEVKRDTHRPTIVATGTVEAAKDIVLRPQVGGQILSLTPEFTPGGFVEQGDTLVRIEPADFRHALAQRESDLRQAQADLAVEEGRQGAARADYEYLGEELPTENRELVLRKPQLQAAKERVRAAKSAVQQAKLELRRTRVRAPFDAHVVRRDVNVGSHVSPSDGLGRLVGMDTYWVSVELPLSKLRWISIPDNADEQGSQVRVRNRTAWPDGVHRTGSIFKLVGTLDEDTRMAQVLVSVPDPLAREETDRQRLMVGEFVEASIRGLEIPDVVRIERDYVREDDTVWTMEDGELRVKEVDIVVRDAKYAYVSSGLEDGDQLVTTNLSTVVDGAPLRTDGSEAESGE
jgi:RND family efflux transporter MFP subunit